MGTASLSPLETLVLLRVATSPDGRATWTSVTKDVEPYLEPWFAPERRAELLQAAIRRLIAAAVLAEAGPRALSAPQTGRRALLAVLGRTTLPPGGWSTLRDVECVAAALGLLPLAPRDRDRFRTAEGLRAALLRKKYDLPLPPVPTDTQAAKALAWKRLEGLLQRPLDPSLAARSGTGPIADVLLGDWLEDGVVRPRARALALLAARAAGTRATDAPALRRAVLSAWIQREAPP